MPRRTVHTYNSVIIIIIVIVIHLWSSQRTPIHWNWTWRQARPFQSFLHQSSWSNYTCNAKWNIYRSVPHIYYYKWTFDIYMSSFYFYLQRTNLSSSSAGTVGGGGEGLAGQVWVDGGRGLVKQVGEDWGLVVRVDRGGGLVEQVGGGRDRAQKAPLMNTKNSKQIKEDDVATADNQTISTDYLEKIWEKVERENMRECVRKWNVMELRACVNEWDRMWVLLCEWVSYREKERMISCA